MSKNLKTTILVAAGVAFTLASCSEDETIAKVSTNPGERQEIEFTLDMMSRGTDRTIANLDTIWVYADDGAAEVFPATAFIKNEYGYFKPEKKIYWPDDKENLNFTAFWPRLDLEGEKRPASFVLNPGDDYPMKYKAAPTVGGFYDFITATRQMSKEDYKGTIALNFTHALTQVDFKVKQNPTADHRIEIYGYLLYHSPETRNYRFSDNSWEPITDYNKSIRGVSDEVLTVGEVPTSILPTNSQLYLVPGVWKFARWDKKMFNSFLFYLQLFVKIYDEDNNLIYPSKGDKNVSITMGNQTIYPRIANKTVINNFATLRDISECGIAFIQLGTDDLEAKPGYKYVFNIDFTFGAGYYSPQDPNAPYGPILKNPISAEVTIEEWNSTELDDMEQN